jgi:hypothetical protein
VTERFAAGWRLPTEAALFLICHPDGSNNQPIRRHPGRVPGFHRCSADCAFKTIDLASRRHGLGAPVDRSTGAGSLMGLDHRRLCAAPVNGPGEAKRIEKGTTCHSSITVSSLLAYRSSAAYHANRARDDLRLRHLWKGSEADASRLTNFQVDRSGSKT